MFVIFSRFQVANYSTIEMSIPKYTVILLLLLIQGCSLITVGYNNFDVYLRYKINSYATFTDEQKIIIRREVDDYMAWHRQYALPEYIIFLEDLLRLIQQAQPPESADVARLRARVNALYIASVSPAIPPAAKFLSELNEPQIAQLKIAFAQENKKRKQEWLGNSAEENLQKRAQRTLDFMEDFVGNLDAKQKEKIRAASIQLPFATEVFFAQRVANQEALIMLLNNKSSANQVAEFLTSRLQTPALSRTAQEHALLEQFQTAADAMVAYTFLLLNAEQKNTLQKTIVDYIDDLKELHKAKLKAHQAFFKVNLGGHHG